MSTAPTSPLEKKATVEERVLTDQERIQRLEFTFERAFNMLGKEINQLDMQTAQNFNRFQNEVTHAITMLNASNLQNIITIKEMVKLLGKANVLDEKVLNANITEQVKIAVAQQQEIMEKMAKQAHQEAPGATLELSAQ